MAISISILMAAPLTFIIYYILYSTSPPPLRMMGVLAISKIPASSESAVQGEGRSDFLAVVLSWPADAIQPRSLITQINTH